MSHGTDGAAGSAIVYVVDDDESMRNAVRMLPRAARKDEGRGLAAAPFIVFCFFCCVAGRSWRRLPGSQVVRAGFLSPQTPFSDRRTKLVHMS